MNLQNVLKSALMTVTNSVYHYTAGSGAGDKYIVWAEDGEASSLEGDNVKLEQSISGTVKYYTKTEYDPNFKKIQQALNTADISFYLFSTEYDEETQLIEYTWIFEVAYGSNDYV